MLFSDYILNLFGIVSALAVGHAISSAHTLIIARRRIRWDWVALAAALFAGYTLIYAWWVSWSAFGGVRTLQMSFWRFILLLGQNVSIVLSVRAAFPDVPVNSDFDFRDYYTHVSRYIWWSQASLIIFFLASLVVHEGPGIWQTVHSGLAGLLINLGLSLVLGLTTKRQVHAVLIPIQLILLIGGTIWTVLS